jgi:plasmid stability protein
MSVTDRIHLQSLAFKQQRLQNACMTIQITIRNVPKEVRDELASRAALQHQSMQEYLRGELERIATRPTVETWLKSVRERKAAAGTRIPAKKIIDSRNTDRK